MFLGSPNSIFRLCLFRVLSLSRDLRLDAGSVLTTASGPCGVRNLDKTCRIPSLKVSAFSSTTNAPSVKEVMSSRMSRMHCEYLNDIC